MALLLDPARQEVANTLIRLKEVLGWANIEGTKADVRVVVNSFDQYLEDNANAINLSIPAGVRLRFTAAQKAVMFAYTAIKRYTG